MLYKYVGVSVAHDSKGNKTPHVHVTKGEAKIGIALIIPGKVEYHYLALPRPVNKLTAYRFLRDHKDFKTNKLIQDYIATKIAKLELEELAEKGKTKTTKARKKTGGGETGGAVATPPVGVDAEHSIPAELT